MSGIEPPPLALYLHFPWCVKKCPYCDFNSHPLHEALPEAAYLAALEADLNAALARDESLSARTIGSIFMGGGTPILFSPEPLHSLLDTIRARLTLAADVEITLEANPGTLREDLADEKLGAYQAAGINRLSLGIQSFDSACLVRLGRIHNGEEARQAVERAIEYFPSLNLDLMYGLPGQTFSGALADLEKALASGATHLSCYQLGIEPHTAFAVDPPSDLPDADLCADMQDALEARFSDAGFLHYEISAFARPGFACRHNLNYWQFGDYLGLGAGAHSKLTAPSGIFRQTRWRQPETYIQQALAGNALETETPVPAAELPVEFLMNALRLVEGFAPSLMMARTGCHLSAIRPQL
ncbi:MAG: radical SAM family heme chaperone HemW [Zoogloeaceae bacterium]|jgi:oxygen-independent coproporphyrinogen-3 oxidase|nr:radical SAM family heme chaperone HemW [Zoogloeaceae bacterium]